MLVLTRKPGEKILLQDDQTGDVVELMVVEVRGERVRLGIQAPKHIQITRPENLDRSVRAVPTMEINLELPLHAAESQPTSSVEHSNAE